MPKTKKLLVLVIIFLTSALILKSSNALADWWKYRQSTEALNDKQYSLARVIERQYRYNDDFTVGFQCTIGNGQIRFSIDTETPITDKGKEFTFIYRVEKEEPRKITMRTFSNNNQGGYTYKNVEQIAKDMLGGEEMFVRAITWDNEYLETYMSLLEADKIIPKLFSDCGVDLDSSTKKKKPSYTLYDFTTSFKKLIPAKQAEVLKELQELMKKHSD